MQLDDLIDVSAQQWGDKYIFGAQPAIDVADPKAFDCSGFTRWVCGQVGVYLPAGSWYQARRCRDAGTLLPIGEAIWTRGALLFRGANLGYDGFGADGHVAFALGNGWTSEARGSSFGVGTFTADMRRQWTNAGRIPGLDYSEPPPAPPQAVIPPAPPEEDDEMTVTLPKLARLANARFGSYTLKLVARPDRTVTGEVWAWNDAPLAPYPNVAVASTQIPGLHVVRLDDIAQGDFGIDRFEGSPKGLFVNSEGGLMVQMDDGGQIDIRTG